MTAVAAPALLLIVGFAIDYGYASYINQRLARATDDATLGSVSQTAATAAGGYGNTTYLQQNGAKYFAANIAPMSLTNVNFTLSVVSDGSGGVIANGSYSYNVPTFFSGILGFNTIPLSGTARTTARPTIYVSYYILVDTSQSMGIASTQDGMNALWNLVIQKKNQSNSEPSCVFGCHVIQGSQPVTNEKLAHDNNIELRVDAAVSAIKTVISQAQSVAGATKNISFTLFTIQQDSTGSSTSNYDKNLHVIATTSTNYSSLLTSASSIDLGNNTKAGIGDTDIPNELVSFQNWLKDNKVTSDGSGASSTAPLNYFLIVTDGVTDVRGSNDYQHTVGAIDPSNCTPLKSKGTVAVIYTTYNPIWDNNDPSSNKLESNYKTLVDPIQKNIRPNLVSCASSSDLFFEASDGPAISSKMQAFFQKTQPSSARITQ